MVPILVGFITLVILLSIEVLLSGFFSKKALKEEDEKQFVTPYKISTCKSSKIFNIITIVLIIIITVILDVTLILDSAINNFIVIVNNSVILFILILHIVSFLKNLNVYFIVNDSNIERHFKKQSVTVEFKDLSYTVCNIGILMKNINTNEYYLIPDTFVGSNHLRKLLVSKESSNLPIDEVKRFLEGYNE